ncbi:MAG: hypothetical protein HOK72_10180, partial [Flavobacteriales bacterium]|nr:hypothetical protein [Flavobacteriales bacterium]
MTKLNRHLNSDLLMLFALGFLLNVDRLAMGEYGFLRRLDVSDMYLNKILFLSNYWTIPIEYGWNSSILRGWPSEIGSIGPQYFGVLLAAVFPIEYVFPILHLIIDVLVLYGAYLFVNIFLGFRRETAIFGAFLFLGINYWYNENPLVTASPLLPLLVAVTSYGKKQINHSLRFVSLILITSLSFPPYVLPIMPMAHVLLLLVFYEQATIKQNLVNAVLFWVIYTIFHGVSILGYLQNLDTSNRYLWEGGGQTGTFIKSFISSINHSVLFPSLMVIVLAKTKTVKPLVWALGIIVVIITISAFNGSEQYNYIIDQYPNVRLFSYFFGRVHNFIGITIFLAGIFLLEEFTGDKFWDRNTMILTGLGMSAVLSLLVFIQHGIKLTLLHFMCSVVIIGSFYFYRQRYFRNGIVTLILLFIVVAPFRISYSMMREQLYQGNLFIDPFTYETEKKAFRVATIMDKPWSYDFFDAQVSIKGLETFGGNSVFYSGSDVKQWQYYVADDAPSWEGLGYTFKNWNNR